MKITNVARFSLVFVSVIGLWSNIASASENSPLTSENVVVLNSVFAQNIDGSGIRNLTDEEMLTTEGKIIPFILLGGAIISSAAARSVGVYLFQRAILILSIEQAAEYQVSRTENQGVKDKNGRRIGRYEFALINDAINRVDGIIARDPGMQNYMSKRLEGLITSGQFRRIAFSRFGRP